MSFSVLAAARDSAEECALVVAGGPALTYRELGKEVDRTMGRLRALGLNDREKSSPIALVARPGVEDVITIHALMEMGLPILLVHPRLTQAERMVIIGEAGAPCLLDGKEVIATRLTRVRGPLEEGQLAVVPTSGTSGKPKLAVLSRAALIASARASESNLGWRDGDRWLLCMPLAHIGGLSIMTRVLLGRRCVVVGGEGQFDAESVIDAIHGQRVTLLSVVPTMLHRMLEREPRWDPPRWMRAMLVGGAPAPARLIDKARLRGWPVLLTYGLTEACSQVATQRYGMTSPGEGAGAPLDGIEVRIEAGIVHVRGPTMMDGYMNAPSPFLAGGWFPTGDCGELDVGGNLHIHGRRTDLIITGGENVYPEEVEAHLEGIEGVKEVCAFGVPDEVWGQVVAVAVVGQLRAQSLQQLVAQCLAPHKRPRLMAIVPSLSRTASGKINRAATAAAVLGALQPLRPRASGALTPPSPIGQADGRGG